MEIELLHTWFSCDPWHGRLRHNGSFYNKKIKYISLLHNVTIPDHDKCDIYVESKYIKKSHKSVYRKFELPELVHCSLSDKNNIIRGDKKFYVTFIDSYFRQCWK